jgi:myo-inositol 2-dehydrogenase/D-chiro-inositol 1-dehydrogenase
MPLKIGVIGTGMIGEDHIRRLTQVLSGAEVVAVTDVDAARAKVVAARIGARQHESGEALIADANVEAVVIASWGRTHSAYVLAALDAEKPIFCEKPLATSVEDCLAIVKAEAALGRRLVQVGFMRRFDASYMAMQRLVAEGRIGAPLMFHSVHRNVSVPASYIPAMILDDTCVHDIDISRWLLADEVAAVTVKSARRNSKGRPDLADPTLVLLEMAQGGLVDIEISVQIGYGYDIRGEVVGETGTVTLATGQPVDLRSAGAVSGHVPEDWRERFIGAYDEEFRHWLTAAAAGGATGPSCWDGYAATLVTTAAARSRASGKTQAIALVQKPALYA